MSNEKLVEQNINNCILNKNKDSFESTNFMEYKVIPNIVTQNDVKKLVKDAISRDTELIDFKLQQYSEEKIGFLGAHLRLTVHTKRSKFDEHKTQTFFVKTIPFAIPAHGAYVKEKGIFRKEIDFFQKLVPLLMKNFKGDSWAPECYLANDNTIIFEDLRQKGFVNRTKFFNEESTRLAIACIARFHASSIMAEEYLNGKTFNELYPELMQESEFKLTGRSYTWFTTAINLAVSIADDLGLDSSAIHKASQSIFEICKPSQNKRNVISHGDLWSGNVLFDDKNHCNLVDFQTIRYAPLAHDVIQLLYLTTSKRLREKCEYQMIEYYYKTLIENLSYNEFDGVVPTFKEILQGVEEQRLPAIVTATIFLPTTLMHGKKSAKILDNPVTYELYQFNSRVPFVYQVMSEDSFYDEHIKEVVKELVEMSLVLDRLPRPT